MGARMDTSLWPIVLTGVFTLVGSLGGIGVGLVGADRTAIDTLNEISPGGSGSLGLVRRCTSTLRYVKCYYLSKSRYFRCNALSTSSSLSCDFARSISMRSSSVRTIM